MIISQCLAQWCTWAQATISVAVINEEFALISFDRALIATWSAKLNQFYFVMCWLLFQFTSERMYFNLGFMWGSLKRLPAASFKFPRIPWFSFILIIRRFPRRYFYKLNLLSQSNPDLLILARFIIKLFTTKPSQLSLRMNLAQ